MRVLLIGRGGREHAIAWKLQQSAQHVFVVPGNGGTAKIADNVSNIDDVCMTDLDELVKLAQRLDIDLVIPGPDDVIVAGVADVFQQAGIPCFAPSKAAAELEGSKVYAKDFMLRHHIPTATYESFDSFDNAKKYVLSVSHRVVIKVSGLASGKGVVLPESKDEACNELYNIMVQQKFGHANAKKVVIEEFMEGDEISVLTFSDGYNSKSLPPCQDHKRIFDGSQGPNTGGMGVYGPTDFVSNELMALIEEKIIQPTLKGLRTDGRIFRGLLFTGVMITPTGPKVLEYNVRFGDPETQSLIPLLDDSTDLVKICQSCLDGTLQSATLRLRQGYACNVILASAGYPDQPQTGDRIAIRKRLDGVHIFHAGTRLHRGQLYTDGGRVFSVAAVKETLVEAVDLVYSAIKCIGFQGMQFRSDIGSRCLPDAQR